ncbi:MAG TPA: FAD-dependent oxidoreductase, partial [Pseudobdellovibrionaceae bacterium]|nr:FAD-dependent oxidoreductase [Pseudobdellovibrionaceae bacterium]
QSHFQANLEQVSALQVLVNLDFSFYQGLAERKSIIVPQGGFQRCIDHLSNRLSGSVGAFRIKTNTQLIQIAERKTWFECQLQSLTDSRWVLAKRVIMTVPIQALKQIKGITDLNLSERKKQFISQVQSVSLKSSSRIQPTKTDGLTSLIIKDKSIEWASKDEQRQIAFADLASAGQAEQWETSIDWSSRLGTWGGRINYRPGEYLTYLGAGSESAYDHRLCFAGDTTPASQFNDLEGAIASARLATERILTTF